MGRISTVPINNFQGTQTSPSVAVPAGATVVVIDFDGTTMLDPAVQVDTKIEFAPDGTTWRQIGGANFQCGSLDRQGNPRAVYPVGAPIPTEDGGNRRLRGTLTVNGGALTTVLHISTTP
jgi:hypothetical protein